ncbi:MAG: 3-dehydroquinate synthase [Clostridia bacterium]|nr:3-dehydroquinate synthase [Clostridia bacterium]
MRKVHVAASTEYDVLIGEGLIDKAGELTKKVVKPCKCLIVTDDTVDELYGDRVQISFSYAGFDVSRFAFPAGEASKNLSTLSDILDALGVARLSRSDLIVALGGGVVGDIAGFAAASYTRGIRFVQIPTTLLAAVDSSVGGKTAIDMPFGKNMVGAFHQPSLVVTDTDVLRELPALQLSNGAAEAVKCGVLNDPGLFALLEGGDWLDDVDEVVARCVAYKRDVVAGDEFDTGSRAFLNLGHTFGHAIEHLSGLKLLHGQAVAVGTVMAASAAGCPEAMITRLAGCMKRNGLTVRCDYDARALADAALADKKRSGSTITLVLPDAIGKCHLEKVPVTDLPAWFERALAAQEALKL